MGEPATVIRAAAASDADALGVISGRAWRSAYPGIVPDAVLDEWVAEAPEGWHAAFATRPSDSPWRPWVAERDGMLVGYATTTPAKSEWLPPPDGAGELTNLYLDPAAIGTGVGRMLYEHAVADLRDRGFNPLVIWAFRDNPLARRFYDRMGLTVDVADHAWLLGGVACPIVRYRLDWPADREPA
jgi:ribosomal protein S18 acetylase RimI-like enzyme